MFQTPLLTHTPTISDNNITTYFYPRPIHLASLGNSLKLSAHMTKLNLWRLEHRERAQKSMLRCLFWVSLDLNVSNYPLNPHSAVQVFNHPAGEAPIKEKKKPERPGHPCFKPHLQPAPSLKILGSGRKGGQILAVSQATWAKNAVPRIWRPVPRSPHVCCTWKHYLAFLKV